MTDIERILQEYCGVKRRIKDLELQLAEIEEKKAAEYDKLLKVKRLKADKVRGGPKHDPIVDAVSRLVDNYAARQKKIAENMAAANGKLAFIEDIVAAAGLSEIEFRYVQLRYYKGVGYSETAKSLYCSPRTCDRIRQRTIEKVEKAL